jgi:hypothetical protein
MRGRKEGNEAQTFSGKFTHAFHSFVLQKSRKKTAHQVTPQIRIHTPPSVATTRDRPQTYFDETHNLAHSELANRAFEFVVNLQHTNQSDAHPSAHFQCDAINELLHSTHTALAFSLTHFAPALTLRPTALAPFHAALAAFFTLFLAHFCGEHKHER